MRDGVVGVFFPGLNNLSPQNASVSLAQQASTCLWGSWYLYETTSYYKYVSCDFRLSPF